MDLQGNSSTLQGGSGISLGSSPGATSYIQSVANPQRVATLSQPQLNGANLVPTPASVAASGTAVNNAVAQGNSTSQQVQDLLQQIRDMNKQTYAPNLDLSAINAQARASAENNVNPYYVKSINDYLAKQAAEKQQQQAAADIAKQNLQDTLKNTLAANATAGTRAAQDAATREEVTNTAADQFQTDSGQKFAADRIANAVAAAKAGETGGLGAQGQETAQAAHNTAEGRQMDTFQKQNAATELAKGRTFEDLATSGNLAGEAEKKGEAATQFSLDNFITNQGFDLQNQKNTLEQQRLAAVGSETNNQAKLLINNFISSIANPAQRQAAVAAYGGIY